MLGGKKNNLLPLRLNGTERIAIKTLHGSFSFTNQRFLLPDGSTCHYLGLTGQSSIGSGLEEFCLYFCNRLSFSEVVKLVERVGGEGLFCEQTLWNRVQKKAQELSSALSGEVEAARSLPFPAIAEVGEIYDEEAEEVLVSTDAIQVKAQKRTRKRAGHGPKKEWEKKAPKRINTDLMLVQGRDGSFRCLCGGLDGRANLFELAQAHLRREWGERSEPLPIVAITDGARHIRLMLENLFGSSVRVILDWYHLSKKVYQLLSMVAHSSKRATTITKAGALAVMAGLCWRGAFILGWRFGPAQRGVG